MPTSWPTTLPQYVLQDGYRETPHDQIIRSQPDAGGAKARRRFTAKFIKQNWTLQVTAAQLQIFEDFYFDTLKGGALTFNAPHPRTRTVRTFKITGVYDTSAVSGDTYRIAFPVELQP